MFVDERLVTLFKQNCQHTLTYWSVFFSFGLCIDFLGPTILDLKCQTNSTLQEITWVFFSQQFCLLIGSSIGGVFRKTLLRALVALFVSTLVISLVFAIIPLCYNVLLLAVAIAISGLAMGIIDTIANIQLVALYQKDSAIFLQVLHFFIGFGALVSPLIADPFLSEHCQGLNSTEDQEVIIHHFRRSLDVGLNHTHQSEAGIKQSSVSFAFWIMALINLPVPIAVFVLMYREKLILCCSSHLLDKNELAMVNQAPVCTETQQIEPEGHKELFNCCLNGDLCKSPPSFFGIHILGGMVLFMTDGIVGAYAGFAYTYAVSPPMSLHAKTAGYLPCVFWAAITGGRLMTIPLAYRFRPAYLLLISLAGVIVIVLLLLIFYTSSMFLFVGTCLLGLCLSSVFPCMLAYTEDILDYQGCATTVLVTCAGMGEMVLQVLVGSIMQTEGSYSFLLCGMITGCIGFALFFGLVLCHRFHRKYLKETSKKAVMVEDPAPTQGEKIRQTVEVEAEKNTEENFEEKPDLKNKIKTNNKANKKIKHRAERKTKKKTEDETKETPEDETKETPKDETKETPIDETKETPEEETKETPIDETKETPEEETKETPKDETKETPEEETKETPEEETKETPEEETKETPEEETKETPEEETKVKDEDKSKEKPEEESMVK